MDASLAFFISYVVLWILVVGESLVLLALIRALYANRPADQQAEPQSPAAVGAHSPTFQVVDANGITFDSRSLNGRSRAFLFVSTSCRSCIATLEELRALRTKVNGGAVVVVCRDRAGECGRVLPAYGLEARLLFDEDHAISDLFEITSVPTAVLIDADDRIQKYGYPMRDDIEQLIASVTEFGATNPAAASGD
jgi:peroxiredoxin